MTEQKHAAICCHRWPHPWLLLGKRLLRYGHPHGLVLSRCFLMRALLDLVRRHRLPAYKFPRTRSSFLYTASFRGKRWLSDANIGHKAGYSAVPAWLVEATTR